MLRVKGPAAAVRDVDVIEAGQHHRLVDNKIASFSETLAAMRLVIPVGYLVLEEKKGRTVPTAPRTNP